MDQYEETIEKLQDVSGLGIALAIDDFGTGYSSLMHLKRLPVNKLKIDKSFIGGLPGNSEDVGIVNSIIDLAKILNINVIAEGVETIEQSEFLMEQGCPSVQGYYY